MLSMIALLSCVKDINEPVTNITSPITRTQGDGVYESLGYSYDITEEYLGINATRLPIINVKSFIEAHPERFNKPILLVLLVTFQKEVKIQI